MAHLETLRKFVVDNFLFGEGGSLKDDTSFMQSGIVDSTGILEVVNFLEETWGITLEDDELVPENLDTLKNLDAFVRRKLGQGAGISREAIAG